MKFQRNNTPLKTAKTLAIGTLAFASLGIALSGCRKSFLDETPRVQTPTIILILLPTRHKNS